MKTVIVTGASGNMGQAVVKKFLAEGYFVVGTVSPGSHEKFISGGQNLEQVTVDLTNEADTGQMVADVISKYKNIDTVVSTVGGFATGDIAHTKTSDIAKQYTLNFETAYNIARPVFAHMLQNNSGRIFLVGSKPGLNTINSKGMVAYGLAKSMVFRLAELMNAEAKGTNVITSVIVPGTIDTPPNRLSMPMADFNDWVKPDSIASVIYFYCSSGASGLREPVIKIYNNS